MKKLKGFTTMELSIVMLMAGLISSMAYSGYSLFVKQFYHYSKSTSEALEVQQLVNLMKRDLDQCRMAYASQDLLECTSEQNTITWSFENETYLLRTQSARTDTFHLALKIHAFAFRGQVLNREKSIMDEVRFSAEYMKMDINPIFKKQYSNKDLMELENKNGH